MDFYSRDMTIMRQSQIKMALEYVTSVGVTVTLEELDRITELFVELCMRPKDEDLKKRIRALDKWLEEKKQKNG